jgi:hypothetical protein
MSCGDLSSQSRSWRFAIRNIVSAILVVLEVELLLSNIRIEYLSILYSLRVKNLPDYYPIKKTIEKTSLSTETRSLSRYDKD